MRISFVLGIVVLTLAIGVCVLLGSIGWFVVGFGIMTDCTNDYSCSTTGCSPCATTERWINAGGITQWLLVAAGIAVMVHGIGTRRGAPLVAGAAALLAVSTLTIVGTTWRASESYCRPGTPDYGSSHCSIS